MFGTPFLLPRACTGGSRSDRIFFRVDGLQLSTTVEVPLQKSVIHVQTWRFATFYRSRRRRRCLFNLPEV